MGERGQWQVASGKWRRESTGHSPLTEAFPYPRDAVDDIMETFPIVKRKDIQKYGEYRTKRMILEIYDDMAEARRANSEWRMANRKDGASEHRSPLAIRHLPFAALSTPRTPTDADGNFIPMTEWNKTNWPSHIHPPRNDSEVAHGAE